MYLIKQVRRSLKLKIGLFFIISLLSVLSLIVFSRTEAVNAAPNSPNPIVTENQKPGTSNFLIKGVNRVSSGISTEGSSTSQQVSAQAFVQPAINGYFNKASINKGESINLHVSTSAPSFNIEVYRAGWYNGDGARLITSVNNRPGVQYSTPTADSNGRIEANWPVAYTLQTVSDWVSGFYLVKLVASNGASRYAIFILRDDSSTSGIIYQVPVSTFQAYNNWGGKSLYDYNSTGGRAYKVSYNRPYAGGEGSGFFFDGDENMIRYLEKNGYNVTYATSIDTQTNPNLMNNHQVFLSNFHDEYWSKQMRDNATLWRNQGKHLTFFDSNNIYWQVRFETDSLGNPNRTLVCYKVAEGGVDPIQSTNPQLTTTLWRVAPVNKPENQLLGVMYEGMIDYENPYPWVVKNAGHWIYNGTGVVEGTKIPRTVGYEYDKIYNNGLTPANFTILGDSPVTNTDNDNSTSQGGIYQSPGGGYVFSAGTNFWADKLDDSDGNIFGADIRIQKMTANLLNFLIGTSSITPSPTPTPTPQPGASYYQTITSDQPIGYWRLGESTGTILKGLSGIHNGTYKNSPTFGQTGALKGDTNKAVLFNGTSSYGSIPYSGALNSAPFTIEAWAYPTGGTGLYRAVVASRSYPRGWVLYATSANNWSIWVNQGTGMKEVTSSSTVKLNVWTHLVATFNGTTARLYLNGNQVASGVTSSYLPNVTNFFTIAQSEPDGGFFFPGKIDEVSYYNKVLTATQVQSHYQAGIIGGPTSTPTPTRTPTPSKTPTPAPLDTTKPVVNITSPANGALIPSSGYVLISTNASDISGINTIVIRVDSVVRKTCSLVTTCNFSWSVNQVPSGTHTITATATDKSPNHNFTSKSITVTK